MTTAARQRPVTAGLAGHGGAILRTVGIDPGTSIEGLATAIVPTRPDPFRSRLRDGLETLLRAVADRDPNKATAASCRLIGVGPGSTPLGDDYIAACGLTVLTVGEHAGMSGAELRGFTAALYPSRLAVLTTPESARMLAGALAGDVPGPVRGMYRLEIGGGELAELVGGLTRIGASSGRGWAAVIGATALLLG